MKSYKYKTARFYRKMIKIIIFLLSISLIIKCIRIFGMGYATNSTQSLESNLISGFCNYMIQSDIPILNYVDSTEEGKESNIILSKMVSSFPINRYVAATTDNLQEYVVENELQTPILFIQGLHALVDKLNQNYSTYQIENSLLWYKKSLNNSNRVSSNVINANNQMTGIMPIDIISGEVYLEQEDPTDGSLNTDTESKATLGSINGDYFTLDQLLNRQFLYNNFYIIDSATAVDDDLFDAKVLLAKNMTMKQTSDEPQILIYHTHSQEAYADSQNGVESDTIVGVGSYLTKLMKEKYGFNVIHDKSKYDMMEGYLERNLAYNHADDGIEKILEMNPSVEVVIDLHRDGVRDDLPAGQGKRVAKINGKSTAQLMLFNGLSRNTKGEISRLKNPYLQDNLAFSLQLQLKGKEMYSGLMYKNYLHAYRYNLHLRKKSLLIEIGTNRNTLEEAMNAMDYLAEVLYEVLTEKE